MYTSRKISLWNVKGLLKIIGILYRCGKDMAGKQGLSHWDNSYIKTAVIVLLCALKNKLYLVCKETNVVGTFQISYKNGRFSFQKLATDPAYAGNGVGSFAMSEIERIAFEKGAGNIFLEVYDRATHAIEFYKKRGYDICGEVKTLKYRELIMCKKIIVGN